MYLQYVLKLQFRTAIMLLMNLLATEHTHNIPHDTTKAYAECEAFTSLE